MTCAGGWRAPALAVALAVALVAPLPAQKRIYPFVIDAGGEAAADLVMSSPGADWGRAGHEAAMADVCVDNGAPFQVMLFAGAERRKYPVFLGRLKPGQHQLTVEQNKQYSAPGTAVAVADVKVRGGLQDPVLLHTPVLYARKNTVGKFTDVPLMVYAERVSENGAGYLQYTVIFSNEDGGTSTRALMARWGRTTDIEYVYRVDPESGKATIQTRDHKDVEYEGPLEASHPLLMPVTDNNMVAGEGPSPVRYQIAPVLVDLTGHSREQVMDDDPLTYRIAAKELEREAKLRAFGVADGQKVSDPRNHLYVEARIAVVGAGLVTSVRLRDGNLWRSSALGRVDYAVNRDGWIRTTVELPPGTRVNDIGEIGFSCVVTPGADKKLPDTGSCRVEAVSKIFMLDSSYLPGPGGWSTSTAIDIPAGTMRVFALPRLIR